MLTHKDTKDKAVGGERGARGAVQEARLGATQLSEGERGRRKQEGETVVRCTPPCAEPSQPRQPPALLPPTMGLPLTRPRG